MVDGGHVYSTLEPPCGTVLAMQSNFTAKRMLPHSVAEEL